MTEQLSDFYNDGFDWICRRCESELAAVAYPGECLSPADAALANWLDNTRRVLICPRCGLTESVEKS